MGNTVAWGTICEGLLELPPCFACPLTLAFRITPKWSDSTCWRCGEEAQWEGWGGGNDSGMVMPAPVTIGTHDGLV